MEKTAPYPQAQETEKPEKKSKVVSGAIVAGFGVFSVVYLMAPSLIPDFIPIVGAIDEAVATTILISSLSYFGLDLGRLFGRASKKPDDSAVDVESEVVSQDR